MKRFWIAALAAAGLWTGAAETLWDFQTEQPPLRLNKAAERGQTLEFTPDGLKLGWDAGKFIYAELMPQKMAESPAFEKAEFKAFVTSRGGCPVRICNLRLIDATGETFQWNRAVDWAKAGKYVVTYAVTPENADLHWGGNNDNKLDFPVKFSGFSLDFLRESGAGSVIFNGAEVLAADGRSTRVSAPEKLQLADFTGKTPPLRLNRAEARGQRQRQSEVGLTIDWDGAKHGWFEWSFEKPLPLPEFRSGTVCVKLATAGAAPVWRFNIRLIDSEGENFQWEKEVDWTKPGEAELRFDLTPENCAQSWGGNKDRKIAFPVRFLGVSADFKPGSGTGSLTIRSIDAVFQTERPVTDAVDVSVGTGHPLRLLKPGREADLKIDFHNRVDAELPLQAEITFRDFSGRERKETHPFTLAPGETRELRPETRLDRRGIWYVTTRISAPGDAANYRDFSHSVAVMEPAGPTPGRSDGFIFGICSHPNWTTDRAVYDLEALAMGLCGAKVLRMDMEWWEIERASGAEDYSKYDAIVDAFAKQGVELEAILGKTPKWAATEGNLPEYGAWRKHIQSILAHYKGKIRYWEVWNEPDLVGFATFGVPEYLELMRIVREEARKIDPAATILSGGFATMSAHGSKKGNFHEETLAGGRGLFDVHAYHEHGPFPHYLRQVDDLFLPMRRKLKIETPWYANETALTSAGSDEKFQAETLFKKFLFSWARGSIGYNWYNLRNKGNDPRDGEHNYGLLKRDFQPKAAYVVYNTLATLFKGKEFVRQIDAGDGIWILEFKDGGERVLALWNENFNQRADARFLLKCADPGAVRSVDLMGNREAAPLIGNLALVTAGREPAAWILPGDGAFELLDSPLTVSPVPLLVPGRKAPLELTFRNPLPEACRYAVSIRPPRGIALNPGEATVEVPAAGTVTRTLDLEVGDDFAPPFGEPAHLEIRYVLNDGVFQDAAILPVHGATVLPAQFELREKMQTVSLFDADPTRQGMVWRDAADLSAAVRLDCRAGALFLTADVTDDRHVQPGRGADVWQGDNLQIAMQLPGQTGMWEFGLTLLENGGKEVFVWSAPRGFREAGLADAVKLEAERQGEMTRYRAEIPLSALGMTDAVVKQGFRFNLLVNDNDGGGRKGWIHIAPGIGLNKNPDRFPFVLKNSRDIIGDGSDIQ